MVLDPIHYYRQSPHGFLICLCGECRWTLAPDTYRNAKTFADADHDWDRCEHPQHDPRGN